MSARKSLQLLFRPRRLRRSATLRSLVRENHVRLSQLVQPLFVVEEESAAGEIPSMPGIFRYGVDGAVKEAQTLDALGIRCVLLFGIPIRKDATASSNYEPQGVIQRTVTAIKEALPDTVVIADLCNCEYTDHGHCGILTEAGDVDNDATVDLLVRTALTYARSGADLIAPSDMMDGRVRAIREALDAHDFENVGIMSYSAKYASAFYGPFREAADAAPQSGDRRGYQMDPPNAREAMREIALDIEEGADIVMIKPGLPYLDIVRMSRDAFDTPVAVYNVSGEYAMIKAAAANGWIDEERAVDETLASFVRAGADIIVTYFAKSYAARNV
ncbi:MAG: porphobilinogen synthase [Candidatus Eremiobacteraeota bacterium]|nr:porphobilinogen synthase [Candidatus Eremiobacteraeota bacterium]